MRQVGCVAALAVMLLVAVAPSATAAARVRDVDCAVPRRGRIAALSVERISCRAGLAIAAAHERSLRGTGACGRSRYCRVRAFGRAQVQMRAQPIHVMCSSKDDEKVIFRYRRGV